jgi:hypothetical protein
VSFASRNGPAGSPHKLLKVNRFLGSDAFLSVDGIRRDASMKEAQTLPLASEVRLSGHDRA